MNRFLSSLLSDVLLMTPQGAQQLIPTLAQFLKGEGQPEVTTEAEMLPTCQLYSEASTKATSYSVSDSESIQPGSIAVMTITGSLFKYGYASYYSGYVYGTQEYSKLLSSMLDTPEIAGVLLVIDSPGGQASGIANLYDLIKTAEKPVVVLIDGLSASAGYYAIAGATEIWASQQSDRIGSIGAYITIMDIAGMLEKWGIKLIDIYARTSVHKNEGYREALRGNQEPMKDDLGELMTHFENAVVAGRPGLQKVDNEPFTGKVYMAQSAIDMGLIDQVGTFKQALARTFELASVSTLNSDNQMGLFNKTPKLTALKGIEATAISDEQLEAVNDELTAAGIEGVVVLRTSDVEAFEAMETTNTNLTSQVATLTKERDTALTEATRLGKVPGATPSAPVKTTSETVKTDEDETPSFYSETDEKLKEMKAVTKK